MTPLPDFLATRLERRISQVQQESRIPGVAVGLVRDGELVWSFGIGSGDLDAPEGTPLDTAFAIGSITKTFTAAVIMMLRDEGRLALSDHVGEHIPAARHRSMTLRELLSHASGLQREPVGDAWDSMILPSIDDVLTGLDQAEQVLPSRFRWHYSNLAYALLGEVVACVDGRTWPDAVRARLLDPLGMKRTSLTPAQPVARGYYTEPFTDQVRRERWPEMGAFSAAGGLWSTMGDLARWAALLTDGIDGILPAATVDEMTRPEIMVDLESWKMAAGLGLQLFRSGERVLVGHDGGMPGFRCGLVARRSDRTACVVLTNTSAGVDVIGLATELVCTVLDGDPLATEVWRPGPVVPDDLAQLVGPWWSEGSGFTFSVRGGRLEARLVGAPAARPPAVFEPDGADSFRTVSGREQGERLRIERTSDRGVARMVWAGYAFTRDPRTFGA